MSGSQKFISRNRAPRVQIEYDVELYGAQKKVQLPFVMGVMSDLSGKSEVPKGSVDDRNFLEIDIDNFDSRMKAMKPRAAFSVPNTLTGEGNLSVDLVFEKMSDFSPAEIARKVEPLRKLLDARTQLSNLMTYMDGKAGAEELIERLVGNPDQLRALALGAGAADEQEAAFDAMKAAAPEAALAPEDNSGDILAAMAADAPEAEAPDTSVDDALADLAAEAPEDTPENTAQGDILAGMASDTPDAPEADTSVEDALAGMALAAPDEAPDDTSTADALAGLAADIVEEDASDDGVDNLLADIAEAAPEGEAAPDASADVLASIADEAVDETPEDDGVEDALASMAAEVEDEQEALDKSDDILAGMAMVKPENAPDDTLTEDALAGLAADVVEEDSDGDDVGELLAGMADEAPEDEVEADDSNTVLTELAETSIEVEEDGVDDLLADMAEDISEKRAPDEADADIADMLSDMANEAPEEDAEADEFGDILANVAEASTEEAPDDDGLDDLLADMAEDTPDIIEEDSEGSDILEGLAQDVTEDTPEDDGVEDLLADMADNLPDAEADDSGLDDLLGSVADATADDDDEDEDLDDLLADIGADAVDDPAEDDDLADLLAEIAEDTPDDEDADGGLDDLLAGIAEAPDDEGADLAVDAPDEFDLDDLLADATDDSDEDELDLDALLAGGDEEDDDDLESLLADVDDDEGDDLDSLLAAAADEEESEDDLDALLAGLDEDDESDDDLDSLLAGVPDDEDDDLDALLGDDDDDDLDDLLSDLGDDDTLQDLELDDVEETPDAPPAKPKKPAFMPDFGSMSAAKVQFESGARRKFRIAVLGDFSGRGNKGDLEIGAALGKRKAFKLDFDTMEDVIMRFRTTLTLPLGNDGSAVEVELNELDDLHPDELFENVELFNELNMLRRDLKSGRNFEQNVERMKAWGGEFGDFKALSKKRSKGADAPADLRLTDFQSLIGDTTEKPEASAASDLISRIIGPHIVAAADNGAEAMIAAVDAALSTAMSSVLHHPDFQTIEAAWRSLELLGRRVEASAELEVVVYDLSVEEFTADLAAQDDVSQSGLYDMLVEKPMMDESGGPISAVVGLYTWEETPTHAELLARMARISAQMDAPFISAISTGFMGVKPEDRHPLVKKTWDALGEMPEAKYLGLASPRFMLRMPYGKKTEPLDRFDYEEFTVKEGMRSMLMANPALLVAVLLAETKARQGGDMSLGSIMSLNDMPFHYMTDQYGDQVALPCTERLLNVSGAAEVVARGFMPVISVQGQNMVKLGSFQAVGGGELLGIWSGDAAKDMKSGKARMETSVGISSNAKQVGAPPKTDPSASDTGGDDDDLDLDFGVDDDNDMDLDLDFGGDDDLDLDLDLGDDDGMDDLLAGFGDDDDDDDDDDMDAELAALLGDL